MFRNFGKLAVLLLLLTFSAIAINACGGSSEPENRQFDMEIAGGTLNLGSDAIEVKQGDTVTLRFGSDEHGSVHLHGYDIEKDVGPDEITTIQFVADTTGRIIMTFHPSNLHDGLFESETLAGGEQFRFTIPLEMNGETIPYHNHLNHDMTGTIMVDATSRLSGAVEIEIGEDGSFFPNEVPVPPGTEMLFNNVSSERQRVASGKSPSSDGEGETTLGTLDVRPR